MFAIRNLVGRRSILLIGALGCGLSQLAAAIAASINPASSNTLVAFTALFMFFYNGCIATASYLVATELVSSRLRAWTVGSATSVGSLLAWLTNFCTPYFINPDNLNWVCRGLSFSDAASIKVPLVCSLSDILCLGCKIWVYMGRFELPRSSICLLLHSGVERSHTGGSRRAFHSQDIRP